tara:strand:- start:15128 stop:15574 length:447 start_codon:yes stop_codon:yes gene_type:complete
MEINMSFKDTVALTGKLTITLNGETVQEIRNLVVTVGKNWIAQRMQGVSLGVMSHMAIGTGSTAAAAGDTALGTEIARVALNVSGGVVAAAVITFECTYAAGVGTGAITEAGVLNANSAGDMLARTVFATINKGAADSMTISWDVTVS